MRKIPSLKALQAFEAAARRGSFAAAADELHVTASAISHQIRFLEEEIGVTLFHRNTRRIALTDVGANYFQSISEAFSGMEAATRDIERHGKSDILTVHSVPSFATQWLMPRLARFSSHHESIDVRLYASADPVDLNAGLVDADIRYGSVLPSRGVTTIPLPAEAIGAYCSPDLIKRTGHPLNEPADLRYFPIIHSEVNLLSWRAWSRLHNDAPLEFDRGLRFDRSFMAISAAVDGLGVCLESHLLVERELQTGRLVALFGPDRHMIECHSICMLSAKQQVPKIKAFYNWMAEELEKSRFKE